MCIVGSRFLFHHADADGGGKTDITVADGDLSIAGSVLTNRGYTGRPRSLSVAAGSTLVIGSPESPGNLESAGFFTLHSAGSSTIHGDMKLGLHPTRNNSVVNVTDGTLTVDGTISLGYSRAGWSGFGQGQLNISGGIVTASDLVFGTPPRGYNDALNKVNISSGGVLRVRQANYSIADAQADINALPTHHITNADGTPFTGGVRTVFTNGEAYTELGQGGWSTPSVSIAANASTVVEGDSVTYTVTRMGGDQTTDLEVLLDTPTGTATEGDDYEWVPTSVRIEAGDASAGFDVSVWPDAEHDPDETLALAVADGADYNPGSPAEATVTIVDVAPPLGIDVSADQAVVEEGDDPDQQATLSFAATDETGGSFLGTVTEWEVDWGDGTEPEVIEGGSSGTASHNYADGDATYTPTVTATPDYGDAVSEDGPEIIVQNIEPALTIWGDDQTTLAAIYELTLSSADPGEDTITSWTIDWGDGSDPEVLQGNPTSATHQFEDWGAMMITAAATDEDGTFDANAQYVYVDDDQLDLVLNHLGEDSEEDPGAVLAVNNDDDNDNGIADFEDTGSVTGENDLVPLDIRLPSSFTEGTVTLTLSGATHEVQVWADSQKEGGSPLLGGSAIQLPLAIQSLTTLWVESISPSAALGDWTLTLSALATGTTQPTTDSVKGAGDIFDLDVMKVSHNSPNGELSDTVAQNDEEKVGAFLPVNNDDDDYDAINSPDYKQAGPITGENDLVQIALRQNVLGGIYTLDIPKNVRVWTNGTNRTGEVKAGDTLLLNTFYVEGIKKGSGIIGLNWSPAFGLPATNVDRIKVTTFEWSGPLNVPGFSTYSYKANGALAGSKWIADPSGTIKTGANTSNVTILWGEGPFVGKAVYQANDDFIWNLEVNVVQVKLQLDATNSITYKNPPVQTAAGSGQVKSVADANRPAAKANIKIETIDGPTAQHRGVKFIEMGFMQNGRLTQEHADFDQLPKVGAAGNGRRRVSSLEDGTYHLDSDAPSYPWYDRGTTYYFAPAKDEAISNRPFEFKDSPKVTATDQMSLTEGANTDAADRFGILFDFNLYFAVRTKQKVNGSEKVYAQRGMASWFFNGSGTVAAGRWTAIAGTTKNDGSGSFVEAAPGTVVPVTGGTVLNSLLGAKTWATVNQP